MRTFPLINYHVVTDTMRLFKVLALVVLLVSISFLSLMTIACGGGSGSGASQPPPPPPPSTPNYSSVRTRYLRTNAFYDPNSLETAPPHFTIYDGAHKQFFVSNPYLNEIDVFDAAQQTQIAQISVPLAWGIDISPLDGSLYAGTLLGDVYQINTGTLQVINRYASASIGPAGYVATEVFVLSDGRLALLGGQGGILGVDGASGAAVWDPATNSLDTGPSGSICPVDHIGGFAVTGDRKLVLATTVDTGGGGEPLCSYDPVAKVAALGAFQPDTPVRQIIPTPDGKKFFLTTGLNGVAVFDAATLQLLGQITGPNSYSGIPNAAAGAVMTLDGKTLFLVDQETGAVGAFDTTSLKQVGWIPSFGLNDSQNTIVISAIDETGLIIGPTGHGVAFLDASQLSANEPTQIQGGFASPNTGPLSGGTLLTQFASGNVTDSASVKAIYLGSSPGTQPSFSASPNNENSAQVTTPATSQGGTVNLTVTLSDGAAGVTPDGFSYGPTILEVVPNAASAEGGQLGAIIGYGLGQSTSDVQVTVGGQPAQVTVLHTNAPIEPYPFPTEVLEFTIPSGTAGSAVDVTVTTEFGSITANGSFHYVAALESYPITANLQAGIYDPNRDLYYYTDQAQIQILSRTSGKWLTPIPLPNVTSKTQLSAISESPDGSKLAVSDSGGHAIYVLNPDNPSNVAYFPMPLNLSNEASPTPAGLAITNTGMVYFENSTGGTAFDKLDTSTGTFTALGTTIQSGGTSDALARVFLSPDGSRAYSNVEAVGFWVNTSDDQIQYQVGQGLCNSFPDLAISKDGLTVDNGGCLSDPSLNTEMISAYVDWETWLPTAIIGQKLSGDGTILFQPLTDGIDLDVRNTGRLLYRVQIAATPNASAYDPLVIDTHNVVGVITTTGVSFVDTSTLPIPAEDSQGFPPSANSRARATMPRSANELASKTAPSNRPQLRHVPQPKRVPSHFQ